MKLKLEYGELEYNRKTGKWLVVSGRDAIRLLLPSIQKMWDGLKPSGSPKYASPLVEGAVTLAEALGGELSGVEALAPKTKKGVVY